MKKTLTCIGCPLGCQITAEQAGSEVTAISGNGCKRGSDYARRELTCPTRILTTSIPVTGSCCERMVPCKTERDIPKQCLFDVLRALRRLHAVAPVQIGDVLLENAAETGVNVIATKNIPL